MTSRSFQDSFQPSWDKMSSQAGMVKVFCGLFVKMCQIFKFKQSNKLKMSYIQDFLDHHLPQFYLSTLRSCMNDPSFSDFTSEANIFSLTADLLLFAHRGCGMKMQGSLHALLMREMVIPYECLRNYGVPVGQSDSQIMRLMKINIKEVHIQLLQLLLRLLLCYIQSTSSQFLNNTILTHISEISFIYPQVKAEISINYPEINLSAFLQKFLMVINKNGGNSVFIEVLGKIKEDCAMMGNIQRVIDRIIDGSKAENEMQSKKVELSSFESENDDQKENFSAFDDQQLLRKRKKKFGKELVRTRSDIQNRTPVKEKIIVARYTPKTQKTDDYQKQLETKSPLKRTPIFKKIKKPVKKPLERTIYYGQTKRFVPKKSNNPQFQLEKMLTVSTLHNEPTMTNIYIDAGRRTEKKPSKLELNDAQGNVFCIPQTPRPNIEKKNSLYKKNHSMDFFKSNLHSLKG